MKKKWIIIPGVIIAIGAGLYFTFRGSDKLSRQQFEYVKAERGNITETVTATGTLQPINIVSVGTQVSGIIEKVMVDYNDEVEAGQILAELDKLLLTETMHETQAALDLAESKLKVAELNYSRYQDLYKQDLIAKAEMEDAEIALATAQSSLKSAQAAYNKAKQNLGYAQIVSPVSGTVVSKEVEEGQTVASSFQTPTLFTIAENLKLMQIEANVSEADIGKIKAGMEASFTVDAYPTDTFYGTVKQIRLKPTETQNVVMYTVVIDVPNDDKRLLPGMTAFVSITTASKDGVLRIPNTTVQFKPNALLRQNMKGQRPTNLKSTQVVVYSFEDGLIVPHTVELGLLDVDYAEVIDGLSEGQEIISEFIENKTSRLFGRR